MENEVKPKHSEMVKALVKNPEAIIKSLTPLKVDLMKEIVGLERDTSRLLGMTWVREIENLGGRMSSHSVVRGVTLTNINRLHMTVGLAGESGELLDAIKKCVIYDRSIDRKNVVEEFGDLLFYCEGLLQDIASAREGHRPTGHYLQLFTAVRIRIGRLMDMMEVTEEEALIANMNKLGERYPEWIYSDEAAQARADKNPQK